MRKYLFAAAMVTAIAAPAFADEVGVHVGPVGAGVTVGQAPEYRERTAIVTAPRSSRSARPPTAPR